MMKTKEKLKQLCNYVDTYALYLRPFICAGLLLTLIVKPLVGVFLIIVAAFTIGLLALRPARRSRPALFTPGGFATVSVKDNAFVHGLAANCAFIADAFVGGYGLFLDIYIGVKSALKPTKKKVQGDSKHTFDVSNKPSYNIWRSVKLEALEDTIDRFDQALVLYLQGLFGMEVYAP